MTGLKRGKEASAALEGCECMVVVVSTCDWERRLSEKRFPTITYLQSHVGRKNFIEIVGNDGVDQLLIQPGHVNP